MYRTASTRFHLLMYFERTKKEAMAVRSKNSKLPQSSYLEAWCDITFLQIHILALRRTDESERLRLPLLQHNNGVPG